MIMAGQEYLDKIPFNHVYLTGIVRDKLRRKMSKSLGNSPDPIMLMEQFGADGVRVGMLYSSPAGNDLLFDESLCEQGRNFSNKIWNAMRLVKGWEIDSSIPQPEYAKTAITWFDAQVNDTLSKIDDAFEKYRLSDALMIVYKLIWDDFCSWYLEAVKPAYQKPIDVVTFEKTIQFFDKLMKILHPFMPFITEEIWHILNEKSDNESIMLAEMPQKESFDGESLKQFEIAREIIINVRAIRQEKNIPMKDVLELKMVLHDSDFSQTFNDFICKLANLSEIEVVNASISNASGFRVDMLECFIPLDGRIDVEAEMLKINEEITYLEGFLNSVLQKLSNERFVNNAPKQVVEIEFKKRDDAQSKIEILKQQLNQLKIL